MKYINNIKSLLCGSLLLIAGSASFTSCTDWLDKDPEAIIPEDEAFKNYHNFQGYIEEIYGMVPNIIGANYCSGWNMGDDAVHNTDGYAHIDHQVDLGNYRDIWDRETPKQCWLNGARTSLWKNSWYCIRKCNMGIEKINANAFVGPTETRDILLGQLYFFRAWWHFELISFFGGLPYVDKTFDAAEIPELPRLSFQECANRCAEDFEKAYNLLPLKWDETLTGMETSGNNDLRVNKFMALCYLGKCYLWAGSPLMKEFEKTKNGGVAQLLGASSNGKTYDYDIEYCKKAAEAFGKALDMVVKGQVDYKLAEYNYAGELGIYNHTIEGSADDLDDYSTIFFIHGKFDMPGTTEAIFRGVPDGAYGVAIWNHAKIFGPKVAGLVEHDNIIHHPTANLVDQYGMANGQPLYFVENGQLVLNPKAGWDPEHPYKNRDPRLYHDIVFDGFHYVLQPEVLIKEQKPHEYCSLYTGGAMRDLKNGSSTGYFIQKLVPHQCNIGDKWYDHSLQAYIPYMRLADVYLMYAEARAAIATKVQDFSERPEYCRYLSAVEAINKLRDRVSTGEYPMEHLVPECLDTREHFLDEIRRERAVELAFEGFRWNDLQRWLLLTEPPYTVKYSHEFERLEADKFFTSGKDPKDAKIGNFHSVPLITRRLESKHYWFPLPDEDTFLYSGFDQNPGW